MGRLLHRQQRLFETLWHFENWYVALWQRLRLPWSSPHVTYRMRGGGRLQLDRGPAELFLLSGTWLERPYAQEPDFVIRDGWRVLDLGAHKGVFTVKAALAGPAVRVVAVEPAPANLICLRENVDQNCAGQTTVVAAAVAAVPGTASLQLSDSASHHLVEGPWPGESVVEVETVGLDALLAMLTGPADLVKMDIEGAEYEVLAASVAVLSRVRRLVVKCHRVGDRSAIGGSNVLIPLLEAASFECAFHPDREMIYARRISDRGGAASAAM